MADRGHDGTERDLKDAEELPHADLTETSGVFAVDSPSLRPDHCDLLLDAIDAQLGQLQVQPQKWKVISKEHDCNETVPLSWSKDTGLGSTTLTNDSTMSCLDLLHTPTMEQKAESGTGCLEDPLTLKESEEKLDRRTRDKEEMESEREQIIWRLGRLLGDTYNEGRMAGETHSPSDSICTEDFVKRFRHEMVELVLPESKVQQLDKEVERAEKCDCCVYQSEQKDQSERGDATSGNYKTSTGAALYSQPSRPCPSEELEKCLSHCYGGNTPCSGSVGPAEECDTPAGLGDDGSISHRTEVVSEHGTSQQANSQQARCLAGIPMWSFDSVSIDSDLDSVSTDQVRRHIQRRPGWQSFIHCVTDIDDYSTNQSDCDTVTQEESEPPSTPDQRSSYGKVPNRSPSVCEAHHNKREKCSGKDTDEELNHWSRSCRPERTSEKMHSDWAKTQEHLSALRHKCKKEEETLLKTTLLKDVELSLSELQQRRKHALHELEQLIKETAKMEKKRNNLEFVLQDSGTGEDSISCQRLQKQRESCISEKQPGVMSALEREEMDRLLDVAKTELFAEQRRAREKLESMQEVLEETREELQRVTETERLLRSRCACLEEKQRQKKDQIKAADCQVGELQGELGECKIRVGTLERMVAQKELQLLESKETRGVLQEEGDRLRAELRHLKTQHTNALKEAQEQTRRMMTEEEKANALEDQALTLTRHIEALKSSIQLKEDELKKMRDSLERQKQEAKKREEELHEEALEKVNKAVEEERKKWESEKEEAVKMHSAIESMRSEMQREKSETLALQHKVVQLKTRLQELEGERRVHQREQESLLAVVCKSLKEEHQAELRRLQEQTEQESRAAALRLEEEAGRLRALLEEKEVDHDQLTAEMGQQLQRWAEELAAECRRLLLLVEQSGPPQGSVNLPPSSTVAEALANLRTVREQVKNVIGYLQQELDSQKQTAELLRDDKERQLCVQRQQLGMEREQALNALKERLIVEHIEELSSMTWAHMRDGGADGGGAAASLRKQLKAKDLELRQVQQCMSQWKEQTAARLACKFQEEFTAELERCKTTLLRGSGTPKAREERRQSERPEMMLPAKEPQNSPSLHVAASHSPSDVVSFKILHYLQSRVKQLRTENQAYGWSPSPPNKVPLDLPGSCLTTITQDQDIAGIQRRSTNRTVSS